ncbi:hypothetical protein B0H66DRAFT_570502 [Apodospora peruviana]|uniref:Uncharacterized protein n=1 Tax=Apodospora peruviana TaxID=516989 RepID=A0AAE0HT25_9PEZI|nr:hypothetical protein B0H66DRAFT_570502 [Apodospora peruviana]
MKPLIIPSLIILILTAAGTADEGYDDDNDYGLSDEELYHHDPHIHPSIYFGNVKDLERPPPRLWQPGDKCPTAIRATVPREPEYGGAPFGQMQGIHAAMLNCSSIKTLKIWVQPSEGCLVYSGRHSLPFNPRGGDRYLSAPELLSLDGYASDDNIEPEQQPKRTDSGESGGWYAAAWYNIARTWFSAVVFELQQTMDEPPEKTTTTFPEEKVETNPEQESEEPQPPPKRNFDLWLEAMDFSQIHTLQFNNSRESRYALTDRVAETLPPKLNNLRTLRLYNAIGEKFILALQEQHMLQHLWWKSAWKSGWSCSGSCCDYYKKEDSSPPCNCSPGSQAKSPLESVLRHQGAGLESLYFHVDERHHYGMPVLSLEEIKSLVHLAPKLKTLTIDLRRGKEGTWPWAELKTLATSLPDLTELMVYFDLVSDCQRNRSLNDAEWSDRSCEGECIGANMYLQPMVNRTTGADVARLLWRQNIKARGKLRRVELRAGDWGPTFDGMAYEPRWFERKRMWFSCKSPGDGKTEGKEMEESDEGQVLVLFCDAGDNFDPDGWERRCARPGRNSGFDRGQRKIPQYLGQFR